MRAAEAVKASRISRLSARDSGKTSVSSACVVPDVGGVPSPLLLDGAGAPSPRTSAAFANNAMSSASCSAARESSVTTSHTGAGVARISPATTAPRADGQTPVCLERAGALVSDMARTAGSGAARNANLRWNPASPAAGQARNAARPGRAGNGRNARSLTPAATPFRGAPASRRLRAASRRPLRRAGRPARPGTRDACAPRTLRPLASAERFLEHELQLVAAERLGRVATAPNFFTRRR
jgi:hypothetical protein